MVPEEIQETIAEVVRHQIMHGNPPGLSSIGGGLGTCGVGRVGRCRQIIEDHEVVSDADTFHDLDEPNDVDPNPGFFQYLAPQSVVQGFASLDPAAGNGPPPGLRRVGTFDQEYLAAPSDHGPALDRESVTLDADQIPHRGIYTLELPS